MSNSEKIAPSVMIDGVTYTPKGYVWILAYALHGCEWAIEEASKPEFREAVQKDLIKQKDERVLSLIASYEEKIKRLKNHD